MENALMWGFLNFSVFFAILVTLLVLYDGSFQVKNRTYSRMGAVLVGSDKQVFENTRKKEIKIFRFFAVFALQVLIVISTIQIMLNPMENGDVEFIDPILSLSAILFFIGLAGHVIRTSLKPVDLRCMIQVIKARGYQPEMFKTQMPNFSFIDRLKNRHWQVLNRSFFKSFYSQHETVYKLPYLNRAIINRGRNGVLEEFSEKEFEEEAVFLNYARIHFLPDIRLTNFWRVERKYHLLFYIGLFSTLLAMTIFSVLIGLYPDMGLGTLLPIMLFLFVSPIPLLMGYRKLGFLTLDQVNGWLEHIEGNNSFEKMIALVEANFPYLRF